MVKIYTQMLSRRYGGRLDSQGQQCLNEVIEAATRMEILLRDLLEYSRAGDLGEAAHPENAEAALEAALANLKVAIAESGARIQSDQLPVLPVLSTHLQQLFQNLIGNAIKYRRADATPEIYVHAWREGTMWYFSVSDNGIGIEQQFTDEIFGLFKRLHRREEYSGTGIGLAICQRIVERYGGRIWVESKPGEGSIFYFTLPA